MVSVEIPSDMDHDNSSLPPVAPTETVFGLRAEEIPERWRAPFLLGDLVLFKVNPSTTSCPVDAVSRFGVHGEMDGEGTDPSLRRFCIHCAIDRTVGWIILAFLIPASAVLALANLQAGHARNNLAWVLTCLLLLHHSNSLIAVSSLQQRQRPRKDHFHVVSDLVGGLLKAVRLPSAVYHSLGIRFGYFLDFLDVWEVLHVVSPRRPNLYCHNAPKLAFRPLSCQLRQDQLDRGCLVLRLQRYPDLFEWPRLAWANGLYRAYRDYQRAEAARAAFDWMRAAGELGAPGLYSIPGLEDDQRAKKFVWLPVTPRYP